MYMIYVAIHKRDIQMDTFILFLHKYLYYDQVIIEPFILP